MSLSKLKQIHVIIIGAFLCVAAGVGLFFLLIKPQQEELKKQTGRYDSAVVTGNEVSKRQAEELLKNNMVKASQTQVMFDAMMKEKMPNLNFQRRDLGMLSWWREVTKETGPYLLSFAKDPNVSSVQANFTMPALPWNPNDPMFDQEMLMIPVGQVSATGSFKSVMSDITRWNQCKRLVVVSNPSLSGVSPNLRVDYFVTCIIFPATKGGQQITIAGTPGASNGANGTATTPPPPPR